MIETVLMKRVQLFLLHFAGGNCYSFQFLQPYLKEYEFIALELPGRGRRIREPLLTDFDEAAEDLFHQVKRRINGPCIIYGHSMGAILGLKTAHMLECINKPPTCLVVSGNPGPGISDDIQRHLLEKEAFIAELKTLGGIPPAFFENKELLDFFEPILRADFEVNEKKDFAHLPPVKNAIHAIMGSKEPKVECIDNWQQYTLATFTAEVLAGDHFFIHQHAEKLAAIIKNCYHKAALYQY
jgi:external thioesterase TEII